MNGTADHNPIAAEAAASVVIVSRDRPDALARCLSGVAQLYHHPFEVVVVADPPGCAAVQAGPLAERIKLVPFDEPNISAARNAGIAASAGEIVAFIDDDAVPEPSWLDHLTAPIFQGLADATGGFVLGRNGISFQWRARWIDAAGAAHALPVPGDVPFAPDTGQGAIKTEGTNMAVTRAMLAYLGGFDTRLHFYLDETDLNMRLAKAGGRTWLVPLAQVHHGFAASPRRRADRAPRTLFDIGASSEVVWATHTSPEDTNAARAALIDEQRQRLLRHMVQGTCEPRDVGRLLKTLDQGLAEGRTRATEAQRRASIDNSTDFLPLFAVPPNRDMRFIGGKSSDAARLMAQAAEIRASGDRVSVTLLAPGFRRHTVKFTSDGIWLQTGGRAGRADRTRRVPVSINLLTRLDQEWNRQMPVRACSYSTHARAGIQPYATP